MSAIFGVFTFSISVSRIIVYNLVADIEAGKEAEGV